MGPAPLRSRATLGLHHSSPGVRPLHGPAPDTDSGA